MAKAMMTTTAIEAAVPGSASEDARFRARVRESADPRGICRELAGFTRDLGFERAVVLLDEREKGTFTVEATQGYAEDTDGTQNARFAVMRLRRKEEAVAQIVEAALTAPCSTHEATTSPTLQSFDLARALVFGLRDSSGLVGLVIAGQSAGGSAWPDGASHTLSQLLPDVLASLRHRILARVVIEDRGMLLAQKAEIEMLVRELRKRNDEMLDDLEQAREFQAQMLSKPPHVPGIAIQLAYRPHDAVSGDLIDVAYDGTKVRVFLSDTTGHGLRAGLATMLLKAEYESVKRGESPAAVLRQLNSRIVETYRSGALTMTAICFDLVLATGAIVYASAAHPPPVIVHEGKAHELTTGGTLIGLVTDLDLMEGEASVGPGGGIYVYTDGISEAASPSNELFGEERLLAALLEGHPGGNAVRLLEKAAVSFTRPGGFSDDATIVGVKRESP